MRAPSVSVVLTSETKSLCPYSHICRLTGSNSTTVTSTKTVQTTLTHTEVEIVTVHLQVEETLTVNSIVTTTITSDQGTQTEVTYVTTTLVVKRHVPALTTPDAESATPTRVKARSDLPSGALARTFVVLWRGLIFGGNLHPLLDDSLPISPTEARHCTLRSASKLQRRQNDGSTSTSTVIVTTTEVSRTTVKDSKTTTNLETTTITTTIYYTSTRWVFATAV